jgi:hypothetical protein
MTRSTEQADNFIDALLSGLEPAAAAVALAGLLNRGGARLHTLARAQASAHKDTPEWPAWAQLQNASRALVLQASTCRDLAARLPPPPSSPSGAPPPSSSPEPPRAAPPPASSPELSPP